MSLYSSNNNSAASLDDRDDANSDLDCLDDVEVTDEVMEDWGFDPLYEDGTSSIYLLCQAHSDTIKGYQQLPSPAVLGGESSAAGSSFDLSELSASLAESLLCKCTQFFLFLLL